MDLNVIDGLPVHILLLHAVVVLVPLAALALVACAVWPSVARRFGIALPVLGLVTLAFVPFTTDAGEWLEEHVRESDLVERHTELGDGVLPWVVGLAVVSIGVWWLGRRQGASPDRGGTAVRTSRMTVPVRLAAVVVALVVAVGSVIAVYRAGESGARATWNDVGNSKGALSHAAGDGDGS